MNRASSRRAGLLAAVTVTAALPLLAGCEQMPDVHAAKGDIRNAIARGEMTSPRAATVALTSLDGAPEPIVARFRQTLATEAASREMVITDEVSAHYLVRGYLSAYSTDTGTTVSYVYDVYDAGLKRRQQRVTDTMQLPATSGDAWSAVTDPVMTSLVGRSADDLAVALAGTPEAQASKAASAEPKVAAATPVGSPPVD